MALNPIPPQAYTKDTLQKAYGWLLSQGPEIKEMASNQEILVSLYLQATRNGAESLERPSIQNFRTELKSLADMMGNFDTGKKTAKATKPATAAASKQSDYVTEQRSKAQSSESTHAKTTSAYAQVTPEIPAGITQEQLKEAMAAVYEAALSKEPISSVPPLKQGTAISEKIIEEAPFVVHETEISPSPASSLDAESLRKITEIQAILNLSTHHEAIRALIAIGYKKLKAGLE